TVSTSSIPSSILLSLHDALPISGQVVSKSDDPKSVSVVIRSTNRVGARLVFTKITDADNTIKYIGRIISLQHGDSYEIISVNNRSEEHTSELQSRVDLVCRLLLE